MLAVRRTAQAISSICERQCNLGHSINAVARLYKVPTYIEGEMAEIGCVIVVDIIASIFRYAAATHTHTLVFSQDFSEYISQDYYSYHCNTYY